MLRAVWGETPADEEDNSWKLPAKHADSDRWSTCPDHTLVHSDKDSKAATTDDAATAAASTAADDSSPNLATDTPQPLSSQGNEQHEHEHDNKSAAGDSSPDLMDRLSWSSVVDTGNKISQKQHLSSTQVPEASNMQDNAEPASTSSETVSVAIGASASEPTEPQQPSFGEIRDERTVSQRKRILRNNIRTKLSRSDGSMHNMSSGISSNQSFADSKSNESSSSSNQFNNCNGPSVESYTQGHSQTLSSALASTNGQSGSLSHQPIASSDNAPGNRSVDRSNSATGNSSLSPDGSLEPSSSSGSNSTASQATDSDDRLPSLDSSHTSDRSQAGVHGLRRPGPRPSAVRSPRSSFRGRGPVRGRAVVRGAAMSRGRGAGRGGMTGRGAFGSLIPPPINGSQPQGCPGPAPPAAPRHYEGEGPNPISQVNLPSTGDRIQGELPSVLCPCYQ